MRYKVFLLTALLFWISGPAVAAAGITSMSITGTGITANSSAVTAGITPTVNFTTATSLTQDGQTIRIILNGTAVVSGQTLAAADITMTGCAVNTLEASPGTGANNIHEVSITNGSSGNTNPEITITLDANGVTPPTCNASAKTIVIASGQLESSSTAGNYEIRITTSLDSGSFLYYVGDENDVLIEADVDNILSFVIRDSTDSGDQPNVGGLTIGPNLCDLGNLGTAGVQSCAYRLKVATNAVSGYFVSVSVDDDLNNAGDTEFINNTASGSAPSGGTEGYNIILAAGSATVGSVAECSGAASGDCLADSIAWNDATGTIFNNTTASVMYDVSGPNNPTTPDTTNTALVTHRAEQDAGTPAGYYNQLATYTVTAKW